MKKSTGFYVDWVLKFWVSIYYIAGIMCFWFLCGHNFADLLLIHFLFSIVVLCFNSYCSICVIPIFFGKHCTNMLKSVEKSFSGASPLSCYWLSHLFDWESLYQNSWIVVTSLLHYHMSVFYLFVIQNSYICLVLFPFSCVFACFRPYLSTLTC